MSAGRSQHAHTRAALRGLCEARRPTRGGRRRQVFCSKREPNCAACPLRAHCDYAAANGRHFQHAAGASAAAGSPPGPHSDGRPGTAPSAHGATGASAAPSARAEQPAANPGQAARGGEAPPAGAPALQSSPPGAPGAAASGRAGAMLHAAGEARGAQGTSGAHPDGVSSGRPGAGAARPGNVDAAGAAGADMEDLGGRSPSRAPRSPIDGPHGSPGPARAPTPRGAFGGAPQAARSAGSGAAAPAERAPASPGAAPAAARAPGGSTLESARPDGEGVDCAPCGRKATGSGAARQALSNSKGGESYGGAPSPLAGGSTCPGQGRAADAAAPGEGSAPGPPPAAARDAAAELARIVRTGAELEELEAAAAPAGGPAAHALRRVPCDARPRGTHNPLL